MTRKQANITQRILSALSERELIRKAATAFETPDDLQQFVFWLIEKEPDLFPGMDRVTLSYANWQSLIDRLQGVTKYYTITETAAILQTTRQTIYNYIKNGQLRAERMGNRQRISQEALDDYFEPK